MVSKTDLCAAPVRYNAAPLNLRHDGLCSCVDHFFMHTYHPLEFLFPLRWGTCHLHEPKPDASRTRAEGYWLTQVTLNGT